MSITKYREYADGQMVHEDEFDEFDNALPYYDDYKVIEMNDDLVDQLMNLWEVDSDLEAVQIWINDK